MAVRSVLALAFLLVAGCANPVQMPEPDAPAPVDCTALPPAHHVFSFGPDLSLGNTTPTDGEASGNGFREAFLTNDMRAWMSAPLRGGLAVSGNVTLDYWIRAETASPVPPDSAGEQFVMFDQFGSDKAFAAGAATESRPPAPPGTVLHVNHTIALPRGGFVVEAGDRVRLLLSTTWADAPGAPGITVLYGPAHPSQVSFQARCFEPHAWMLVQQLKESVVLFGNQGGPTHAVPPVEGLNRATFPFRLLPDADRLRLVLRSTDAQRQPKLDVDLRLLGPTGDVIYDASSPYTNETAILWPDNLAAFLPPGGYLAQVDAYAGTNYSGELYILMEHGGQGDADEGAGGHPGGQALSGYGPSLAP